ncbi:carotenoid oxygenase [Lentithecium fluviatile CBS 122367]|uniref:Carotenoid oxygenase n=1 Tax=Lentithecium fluviatile CBS 122367 TaxID=1168545 RepID=A0A6G1IMW5_9PLEO|nr:carotenoid oxygenase [Lentithecium fluviatile CBS 122367]
MSQEGNQKKQQVAHPYLMGNFAPVTKTTPPISVRYSGRIPKQLHGGMYVRNGGNPITNSDLGRSAHWFDGDGMLTGVWFDSSATDPTQPSPHFVNQFILTDLAISSFENESLRIPILPSIATLVNPLARLIVIVWSIFRAAILVLLSHFPGSQQVIKRISVANTSILYHDGRALATCESGPPIRVQLPGLETVGWFTGHEAEGDYVNKYEKKEPGFGGTGLNSWMREWTTGHPKVDPETGEMLLFHCNFMAPFVHYSVVPKENTTSQRLLNAPVPRCSGGKMMHDFGVSKHHTVILDLPLTLSPFNLLHNKPVVAYEPDKPSRFGVFPRRDPSAVRWFETAGCSIFHTANTWDEFDSEGDVAAVNMLTCRLTSASLVFSAGNIQPPPHPNHKDLNQHRRMSFFAKYDEDEEIKDVEQLAPEEKTPLLANSATTSTSTAPTPLILDDDEEQCRLYYYRFSLSPSPTNKITHQFALTTIPFEFPTLSPHTEMRHARYIYGCSTTNASFGAALGKATKIDVIVKADTHTLLTHAQQNAPESVTGAVDTRSIQIVLASIDANDPIRAFQLPPKHYAQEARFVPAANPTSEDDGYLLFYVFDESQLDEAGNCTEDAKSELWVLDARDMRSVVCKVELPTRVPYGLHGNWFSEGMIKEQRAVEKLRSMPSKSETTQGGSARERVIRMVG